MQINRKALVATTLAAPTLLVLAVAPGTAYAHGTMSNPPSRTMVCYSEGPESPKSAACKQAVAIGGTQPLYDWNEVNIADAAGRHREIIPDGKLCSAGRDKYRGFDQARADWPATTMAGGASHTFKYRATAPHKGGFELYITKDGYDPAKPLKWSDLETKPFHTVQNPAVTEGFYTMTAKLPAKQGRHLIYAIWQRGDSPEAFYSCSDVVFGQSNPSPAPAPTGTPTATPKPTPTPGGGGAPATVSAGVGLSPATATVGRPVKVTATCGGSEVRGVVSAAFATRRNSPDAPAAAWSPSLKAVKAGTFPVTVHCKNGGLARTTLTVSHR
ncbi:lytic polysaccharide monooxygenase auxiliary activity family 9 protein [Nonomuraea basaltis]|uniref:lytic polysaccharide monooxygenase auxiliary activity family 9 protein n=1 Tax=Nonomuraea basaltis TaxID=2495887 RepID=UPI00110C5EB7|nr:lytic polysaccharide monooxygenase [Nonomuraea basaltis]TMR94392.1 lytic polysaccharide monooxygenase [Nonomuraea basaltis]